jgi:hypothetical protein
LAEPDAQMDPVKTIEASVADLELRELRERLAEIDQLMPVANDDQKIALIQEKQRLHKEIELSGQPDVKSYKFLTQRVSPSQRRG